MTVTTCYAASDSSGEVSLMLLDRRALGKKDVGIEILYCGICHSDLHHARGDWGRTRYPTVPGHEIVGRVAAVGAGVTRHGVGDLVGVGCLVGSCGTCGQCEAGWEQYCRTGGVATYGGFDQDGTVTQGGYSGHVVVDEDFVLRVPETLHPAEAAPLLCAGITTYSPLRHWGVGEGSRVGVVGLGGLGHMAVKLARGMGAHVLVFTTSDAKREDALRMGADAVVLSTDRDQMRAHAKSCDIVVDTAAVPHDLNPYLSVLRLDGTLLLLGAPSEAHPPINVTSLITGRRNIAGSMIGSLAETQEMLDFCGANGIAPDIEIIAPTDINTAFARLDRGDVRYRFVIDMRALPPPSALGDDGPVIS